MKYRATIAGRSFEIEIEHERLVRVDGRPLYVDLEQVGGLPVYSLTLDDAGYVLFVEEGQEQYQIEVQGQVYPIEVELRRPRLGVWRIQCTDDGDKCRVIGAPLAGRLLSLQVVTGERVEAGQVVAVVESMKMQMELKAPRSGLVEAVYGPPERDVRQGEELIVLRAE